MRRIGLFAWLLMLAGCGSSAPEDPVASSSSSSSSSSSTEDEGGAGASGSVGTTSSPGTTSGDTGSSSDDGGSTFLGPDDDHAACSTFEQDCPQGEKCNAYATEGSAWNALDCFPVAPVVDEPGDACQVLVQPLSGFDTCGLGAMCWGVDPKTSLGWCVQQCEGSPQAPVCSDPDMVCSTANDGVLNLCVRVCDPDGDDCPEGQACFPIGDDFVCGPQPGRGGPPGAPGTSCEEIAACDPGAVCINGAIYGPDCESTACCTEQCDLSAPECSHPDQQCLPLFGDGMAPQGSEDAGICGIS